MVIHKPRSFSALHRSSTKDAGLSLSATKSLNAPTDIPKQKKTPLDKMKSSLTNFHQNKQTIKSVLHCLTKLILI